MRDRMTLSEAHDYYLYVASNDRPPADRIVGLLEHAARLHPKEALRLGVVALITFGLRREPDAASRYIAVIRNELRNAERRLLARGRLLLRIDGLVRLAVDEDDEDTLSQRREQRAVSELRRCLQKLTCVRPEDLSDESLVLSIVEKLQSIPPAVLNAEERALRAAWIAAGAGEMGPVQ